MTLLMEFFLLGLALALPGWWLAARLGARDRRPNGRLLRGKGRAPCVFVPVVVRGRAVDGVGVMDVTGLVADPTQESRS